MSEATGMYLHFQDWSDPAFLEQLDAKSLAHDDKIIKIYATDTDPREALAKPELVVIESDAHPFLAQEWFTYTERGVFSGLELEARLATFGLGQVGQRTTRSLFRYSNEEGFCNAAMQAKRPDGTWLIDHPFEDIDGIEAAARMPKRENTIHLDIFFPESIAELSKTVDIENPNAILGMREGLRFLLGQAQ